MRTVYILRGVAPQQRGLAVAATPKLKAAIFMFPPAALFPAFGTLPRLSARGGSICVCCACVLMSPRLPRTGVRARGADPFARHEGGRWSVVRREQHSESQCA